MYGQSQVDLFGLFSTHTPRAGSDLLFHVHTVD